MFGSYNLLFQTTNQLRLYSLPLIDPRVETRGYKYLPGLACQTGFTPLGCFLLAATTKDKTPERVSTSTRGTKDRYWRS